MPNRPHDARDCDESCRCCVRCYRQSGYEVCGWLCEHAAEEHADEIAELEHDGYCSCDDCRMERAADTATEVNRDEN